MDTKPKIRCIIHGSFRKHFTLIKEVSNLFLKSGIEVIAPEISEVVGETNGFVHLKKDQSKDSRVTELAYLKKLLELGPNGFSYYVNPDGKLGTSASYELAIDQLTNTRTLFMEKLADHPAYIPKNSVWKPEKLVQFVLEKAQYPQPIIPRNEEYINKMLQELILPGSIIAVGAIIVDYSEKKYKLGQEREILLVRTHKWGNKFSVIGGKVNRNETLADSLKREIMEETRLDSRIKESICTFDQIKNSGYYKPWEHKVFTDNVADATKREVILNEEAEEFIWIEPSLALQELNIEPNAKKTLEFYIERHLRPA